MSSISTVSVGMRLRNGAKQTLETVARENGLSISQLTNAFADALENGTITYEDSEIVPTGNQPTVYDLPDDDYHILHMARLVDAMRDKKYPDWAIVQQIDQMIDMIRDSRNYDARRSKGDLDGC